MLKKPANEKSQASRTVVQTLSAQFSSPAFRKSFFNDPYQAMERAGIDVNKIPDGILDVLATLSIEELSLVARINSQKDLIEKVADDIKGGFLF